MPGSGRVACTSACKIVPKARFFTPAVERGGADHGGVVGAVGERRDGEGDPQVGKPPFGSGAQARVSTDATADTDLLHRIGLRCGRGLVDEHVDHGLLKGCGQIGQYLRGPQIDAFSRQFLGQVEDGSLKPGEAEVIAMVDGMAQPARKRIARRIAALRGPFDGRAARKAKVEQAGNLVKCFAGCIVECAAQPGIVAVGGHQHQLGMAARDDQHQHREAIAGTGSGPHGACVQPVRVDMPFQVVDRQQRQAARKGQPLGCVHADQQAAGQARSMRHGDGVQL